METPMTDILAFYQYIRAEVKQWVAEHPDVEWDIFLEYRRVRPLPDGGLFHVAEPVESEAQ